jgi:hypothetical protein
MLTGCGRAAMARPQDPSPGPWHNHNLATTLMLTGVMVTFSLRPSDPNPSLA